MVVAVFVNRQAAELKAAVQEIATVQASYSARGLGISGAHIQAVMRAYESAEIRTFERTLEELALEFRHAGRRDANLFWNIVEPQIMDLALSFSRSNHATVTERIRTIAGSSMSFGSHSFAQIAQQITARVHELRLKSRFVLLKTPEDRRANGIPDVAVMMWFPDINKDSVEVIQAAQDRYNQIKAAVNEASNGLATVNKFDDPGVIPQDRISASIETWLEKAALVICDLTGQRQNVYYEFGYTRAAGTDVLLTCPTSEAQDIKLHLGQWQRVEYNDSEELKTKLTEKMKSMLSKYDLSGSL